MRDIIEAKNLLNDNYTCVLIKDKQIITSKERGIKPVLNLINDNINLKEYSIADKIVGKAVALLFIYANIKEVYGEVMSDEAIKILKEHNIPFSYKTRTEKIINRKGDDICPMEKTVININDPKKAYNVLNQKIIEINNKN